MCPNMPTRLSRNGKNSRRYNMSQTEIPKIVVCFEVVSPESAEIGDFEETGIDEEIEYPTEDLTDFEEFGPVDDIIQYLKRQGISNSSSYPKNPSSDWLIGFEDIDYTNSHRTTKTYHFHNFPESTKGHIWEYLER